MRKVKLDDVLFRAEALVSYGMDSDRPDITIDYDEWGVLKVTAKGAWLALRDRTWVFAKTKTWRAFGGHFAWPTKEEALDSLKRRSRQRYRHARRKLNEATLVLQTLGIRLPVAPFPFSLGVPQL